MLPIEGCSKNLAGLTGNGLPEPDGTVLKGVVSDDEKKLLDKLPYYGDTSICKMGSQMALAYADTIYGLTPYYNFDGGGDKTKASRITLKATLYDITGDGFPILITSYSDDSNPNRHSDYVPKVYSYENGLTSPVQLGAWQEDWQLELCLTGDKYGFCVKMPKGETVVSPVYYQFYNVNKGTITESYIIAEFKALVRKGKKEETAIGVQFPGIRLIDENTQISEEENKNASADEEETGNEEGSENKEEAEQEGHENSENEESTKEEKAVETSGQQKNDETLITVPASKLEKANWLRMGDFYYYYLINGEPWNPDALEYHSESPLSDTLYSVGLQLPDGTGDRLVYNKASGLAWWLPTQAGSAAMDTLYELATGE